MSLSLRTLLSLGSSFLLVLLVGPYFIGLLNRGSLKETTDKSDSEKLNELHSSKSGTPTMGGALILIGALASTLLWARGGLFVWISLATLLAFGVIGAIDDIQKLRGGGGKGLSARGKLLLQMAVALALSLALSLALYLGSFGEFTLRLGGFIPVSLLPFWILFSVMVITGSSNAVNLTDGLDGLAAGAAIPVFMALMAIACISGKADLSSLFSAHYISGAEEMMVLLAGLVGGIMGFLWFNCYPAQIFMGDTGSLSLGAIIGMTALILHQPFLLILLAGVFVMETLSVILQVGSYKLWKKRIFKIAPLHHHYQFQGISEAKITVRFWIVSSLLAFFTMISFMGVG